MTYDEIPPLLPPADMPAVRTQADLGRTWWTLIGRLGFPRSFTMCESGSGSGPATL